MNKLLTVVYVCGMIFFAYNAIHKGINGMNMGIVFFCAYCLYKEVKSWDGANKENTNQSSKELPEDENQPEK